MVCHTVLCDHNIVGQCLGAAAPIEPPLLKGGGLLEKQDGGICSNCAKLGGFISTRSVGRDDSARRCPLTSLDEADNR